MSEKEMTPEQLVKSAEGAQTARTRANVSIAIIVLAIIAMIVFLFMTFNGGVSAEKFTITGRKIFS